MPQEIPRNFIYEINVFLSHKNLVYAANRGKAQRVTGWRLIPEYFDPNIQHIAGVDKIVANMLSRFPSAHFNKYDPRTMKAQCCVKKLFVISTLENGKY